MTLHIRTLTDEEQQRLTHLGQSRTAAVRDVERARVILQVSQGVRVPAIARALGLCEPTVRSWLKRFNARGLAGLADAPRAGADLHPEQVGAVVATALTDPQTLGLPSAPGRSTGWWRT